MTIYKKVSAWDELNSFSSEDWEKVGKLVKHVLDHDLKDEFNKLADHEFPNGCEIDEFKVWCETDAYESVLDIKV